MNLSSFRSIFARIQNLPRGWKRALEITISLCLLLATIAFAAGQGDDYAVRIERSTLSDLPPSTVTKSIHALSNWPDWVHHAVQAESLSGAGAPVPLPYQFAAPGALIRITFRPKGQKRREYQLEWTVKEYEPGRRVRFALAKDPPGRISALVRDLEWEITLTPVLDDGATKTRVDVSLWAHTASSRARMLGRIAEKVFLNQLLPVDLKALAELKYPKEVNPVPATGQ